MNERYFNECFIIGTINSWFAKGNDSARNDKFQNKYRISSARLQNWDYVSEEAYFITICTKDRTHYFGVIENGKMILSNTGVIADLMWHEIKNHAKNVELGEFVEIPNHVHGILILNDNDEPTDNATVETLHATSLPNDKNERMAKISPKSNTVSTIIRSYKSAVSKHCNWVEFSIWVADPFSRSYQS